MPRNLRRDPSFQLVLALSLVLLLVSFPVAQNRLVPTSSSSRPHETGTSLSGASKNAAQPDHSQPVVPTVSTKQTSSTDLTNSSAKAKNEYGVLPLSFEANNGQTSRNVKFLARGQGYGLFLTAAGPVMSLTKSSETKTASKKSLAGNAPAAETAVVSWEMIGAKPSPRISGVDALPGKANYFRGNDPSKWQSNISTFSKVRYSNVYPGIDVVYYGNQRQLEYDFIVAPGKDPKRIKLNFKGAEATQLDVDGNLVLRTRAGDIMQAKPIAYQEVEGVRQEVSAEYRVNNGVVSFQLGNFNRTLPLIIDPVLLYSSFLGGSNLETGFAVAVDADGNAYLTGRTSSFDFPTVNAFQSTNATLTDAYVVKLNPNGTALLYSTFLGGDSSETGRAIAVDGQGNAYVAGETLSSNFPTTAGALQTSKDLAFDGYLTKLSGSGSSLVYSTYLGGDNSENIRGIAVGADGRAVVAGGTDSSRFNSSVFLTPRNGHSAFKSTDKADHWSVSDTGLTASTVNTFAVDPATSNTVYAACRTGLFKSTNGGNNWSILSLPVSAATASGVTAVVIDPSNSAIIYAATDEGVFKSVNSGASFALSIQFFDTNTLAIDPATPATVYAGGVSGILKTTNGGTNWTDASQFNGGSIQDVNEIVIDPTNSATLYAGTFEGIYKSTNSGINWSYISSGAPFANSLDVGALVIDPTNPQVIYATNGGPEGVVKSTNGGATWVTSGTGLFVTVNGFPNPVLVSDLEIDPTTPSVLYVATQGGGIFKTTNSGGNWVQSNTGLPSFLNGVTVDRNNPTTLYAGGTIAFDGFAARFNPSGSALDYLVHFGGDDNDQPAGIALDTDGNAYIAGSTLSTNFPTVNALQSTAKSGDAFVSKLNTTGTGFVYSTYLGGTGGDSATGIAVRDGNAFVVGSTFSQDFPIVNGFKSVLSAYDTDAFAAKLNAAGSGLDFSTFLGGSNTDQALGVAVDPQGRAYITGSTVSSDFPIVAAPQSTPGGSSDAFVTELTAAGNQVVYSTYLGGSSSDQANGIAVDSLGNAYVTGVTSSNNFPTVNALQPTRKASDAFFAKLNAGTGIATNLQLSQSSYSIAEDAGGVQVVVNRIGATSGVTTVNYTTSDFSTRPCNDSDGNASSKCDYAATVGTLQFAVGESSKTIYIPIVDDSYHESAEEFKVSLSSPTGASLGTPREATITILDNDPSNGVNPIDEENFFVRQHYVDFLNREPDSSGLNFWTGEINNCTPKPQCTEVKRINVSAAFFLSIEFQETGYLVERLYKVAYGDASRTSNLGPTHQLAVPIIRLSEFLPDSQEIGRGVVVGEPGWEQVLENNKVAFVSKFVQHSRFSTSYSALLRPDQFVDQLFAHAGVTPTAAERTAAINEFGGAATSDNSAARARALRLVAENPTLKQNEKNKAFVLMQYFGYLRRNPDDPQDTNYTGYDFWLTKLNEFNGDFIRAEMVKAFLDSSEYRARFGPN